MRDIDQTTGEVSSIGCLHSRISQTLTGTMGCDEVFEHAHTLLEVGEDRILDNLCALGTSLLRLGHQTTHTSELGNLVGRTTGSGVEHHIDGIESLVSLGHVLHHRLLEVVVDVGPSINHLVVALLVSDETHTVVGTHLIDLILTLLHDRFLLIRHDNVVEVEGETREISHTITKVLDTIKELAGTGHTDSFDHVGDQAAETLLGDDTIEIADLIRHDLVDDDTTHGGLYHSVGEHTIDKVLHADVDLGMEIALALVTGNEGLLRTIESESFAECTRTQFRDIIETKHHILRRHGDRSTIGRVEDVVALKHQHLCLQDSLVAQRQVDSHLVAIEVSIESRTSQRVELDSLTLDELRLESLDTETVERRCTVEEHRVTLHHVLEDVPDDRLAAIHNLLRALHRLDDSALNELADDKRLVELGSHQGRQTTLSHLQLRTDDDHRTGRIVHTLTEQVLTETALLTLQRVGKRLQRTIALTLDGRRLTGVVKQGVNSLLQHTLLVAEDHLRGLDLHQSLQAVVADDDTTIEVVEVGCGKTTTIKGNKRAQVRRRDRDDLHDHPLRTVDALRLIEGIDNLQTLQSLRLALLARVVGSTLTQLTSKEVKTRHTIDILTRQLAEEIVDSLRTHLGDKLLGVIVGQELIGLGQLVVNYIDVLILAEQVEFRGTVKRFVVGILHALDHTRLDNDILLVVDNLLQFFGRQTQQITDLVGKAAEIPNMGYGHDQLNMAGALTTHLLLRHLDTTTVADDSFITDTLVLATGTLIVLRRTEDALAEQTVALGLICTVVDGLRLRHLTIGVFQNLLRRSEADGNLREITLNFIVSFKSHVLLSVFGVYV